MERVSIVVPAFNVAKTLPETLSSLLAQTYWNFEIIIVDDGSSDNTGAVAYDFASDARVRTIRQPNRGLAGARNTGIAAATGEFIAFCDADDLWEPEKLERHVQHLRRQPHVGVSYAGSSLIDDNGQMLRQAQRPRLTNVTPKHILKRNPVGNGSAAVLRRQVFAEIAYRPAHETNRDWFFDETFRQSEDLECWLRIALTTTWAFEGIPGLLTRYRINQGGLSAATHRQFASWERMIAKLRPLDEELFNTFAPLARAYQHRYLCRRAISDLDRDTASEWCAEWLATSKWTFVEEPRKSMTTLLAVLMLRLLGRDTLRGLAALRLGNT